MAQVTIYLPDEILSEIRRKAGQAKKSLSAFVNEILVREMEHEAWPRALVELLDSGDGDLLEPEDLPPEDVQL
jgi:hypothetical protein